MTVGSSNHDALSTSNGGFPVSRIFDFFWIDPQNLPRQNSHLQVSIFVVCAKSCQISTKRVVVFVSWPFLAHDHSNCLQSTMSYQKTTRFVCSCIETPKTPKNPIILQQPPPKNGVRNSSGHPDLLNPNDDVA